MSWLDRIKQIEDLEDAEFDEEHIQKALQAWA